MFSIIFQNFADCPERFVTDKKPGNIMTVSVGVDFGGNGSATTFVASAIEPRYTGITVIADHKMKGGKGTIDPERVNRELIDFIRFIQAEYPRAVIKYCFCDSAEQTLINGIRIAFAKAGLKTAVCDCFKGRITERIYALNGLMTQGRFHVYKDCKNVINSLSSQVWDTKDPTKDVRLDDGTFDIDTADALEYSFSSFINYFNIYGKER